MFAGRNNCIILEIEVFLLIVAHKLLLMYLLVRFGSKPKSTTRMRPIPLKSQHSILLTGIYLSNRSISMSSLKNMSILNQYPQVLRVIAIPLKRRVQHQK